MATIVRTYVFFAAREFGKTKNELKNNLLTTKFANQMFPTKYALGAVAPPTLGLATEPLENEIMAEDFGHLQTPKTMADKTTEDLDKSRYYVETKFSKLFFLLRDSVLMCNTTLFNSKQC